VRSKSRNDAFYADDRERRQSERKTRGSHSISSFSFFDSPKDEVNPDYGSGQNPHIPYVLLLNQRLTGRIVSLARLASVNLFHCLDMVGITCVLRKIAAYRDARGLGLEDLYLV
jgi:hypothetical protein